MAQLRIGIGRVGALQRERSYKQEWLFRPGAMAPNLDMGMKPPPVWLACCKFDRQLFTPRCPSGRYDMPGPVISATTLQRGPDIYK